MDFSLYLVATPIGNLGDISHRALEVLDTVDIIACEDTRHSKKLLTHFDIHKPLISYHEHNQYERATELVAKMRDGKTIALISDAGTPGISDPGEPLVKLCHEEGIKVTAIPGPVAFIQALILSGLPTGRFVFEGFLPTGNKDLKERIALIEDEVRTVMLYEAPHRLKATLKALSSSMASRQIAVVREITKKFETVYKGTIEEAYEYYTENQPRGEFVLVIEGMDKAIKEKQLAESFESITLEEHMTLYLKQGLSKKDAIKAIAKDRKMNKRDVYDHFAND